jgi:hemerythrin-like domain-containing protein
MVEHRLIERMVALIDRELKRIVREKKADTDLLSSAIDFFRFYADRTHHGKEEDILFSALAKKQMSPELERTMEELVEEHRYGRKVVGELDRSRGDYAHGNEASLQTIRARLEELATFYPRHIEKEDKHFFYPAQEYLSEKERDGMLADFREFDRKLVHEKYGEIVEELEKE